MVSTTDGGLLWWNRNTATSSCSHDASTDGTDDTTATSTADAATSTVDATPGPYAAGVDSAHRSEALTGVCSFETNAESGKGKAKAFGITWCLGQFVVFLQTEESEPLNLRSQRIRKLRRRWKKKTERLFGASLKPIDRTGMKGLDRGPYAAEVEQRLHPVVQCLNLLDSVGRSPGVRCVDSVGRSPVVRCVDSVGRSPGVRCVDSVGRSPVVRCVGSVGRSPVVRCVDSVGRSPGVRCVDSVGRSPVVRCVGSVGRSPVVRCVGSVGRSPVVHCLGRGRITVTAEVGQRLHPVVQCETTVGRHVVVRRASFMFPDGLSVCPWLIEHDDSDQRKEVSRREPQDESKDLRLSMAGCEPSQCCALDDLGCVATGCDAVVPVVECSERVCALRLEMSGSVVRGLPVVIDVDGQEGVGQDPAGDRGAPAFEPSDPRGDGEEELIPDVPPDDGNDVYVPPSDRWYMNHVACGHQPYSPDCDICVSSRGVIPARRRKDPEIPLGSFLTDFWFFNKELRGCTVVHELSGYSFSFPFPIGQGMAKLVQGLIRELAAIGVQGQHVVMRMDNEASLIALWRKVARDKTFPGLSMHLDLAPPNRPQAKGLVEVHVRFFKESFWVNWLTVEQAMGKKLKLGGLLYEECIRYVTRTRNLFCVGASQSTPLERLRRQRMPQTRTYPFACQGFVKPVKVGQEDRGKRLVKCLYLGPGRVNGGGVRYIPLDRPDKVCYGSAFRPDLPFVYPELTVEKVADSGAPSRQDNIENRPIKFDLEPPRQYNPGEPSGDLVERGTGQELVPDVAEMEAPDIDMDDIVPTDDEGMQAEPELPVSPVGENVMPDADAEMQAEPEQGDEAIEMAIDWLQDHALQCLFERDDVLRVAHDVVCATRPPQTSRPSASSELSFTLRFGGSKITVAVPVGAADEYTGELLEQGKLKEGMKLEMEELDHFGVCQVISAREATTLVKSDRKRVLSTRWVLHYKDGHDRVRCRLVVRDFKGSTSALADGIYSPTTTLESVRCLLGMYAYFGGKVISGDISVAFMQARLFTTEVVKLPENCRMMDGSWVHCLLKRAMNGLRIGPLAWFRELGETLRKQGFKVTADSTVYRKVYRWKGTDHIVLVLAYVDDILVFSTSPEVAEKVFADLSKVFKMKRTGALEPGKASVIAFLGRNIYQKKDGSLFFGLKPGMLKSCAEEYKITKEAKLPKLERLWKSLEEKPITQEAYQRSRRVLGKLSWIALTRPDLQFAVGFLARSQSNPDSRSEACMRAVLKWTLSLKDQVQQIPATWINYEPSSDIHVIDCFCDASWNLPSVSGAVLSWQGNMLKSFSRKQSVVALSSAEAELSALVETVKEALFAGLLQQSFLEGLPEDEVSGTFVIHIRTDSESAKAIALLRRVRHLELRCAYLQQMVQAGRVRLEFVPGEYNAADGLTKSMTEPNQLENLYEVTGLVPFHEVLGEFDVDLLESDETGMTGSWVPVEYQDLCAEIASNKIPFLVVELFCRPEGSLQRACEEKKIAYVGVTEQMDFCAKSTQQFLSEIFSVLQSSLQTRIYCHISTPCTTGCRFRYRGWNRFDKVKWAAKVAAHAEHWKLIRGLLKLPLAWPPSLLGRCPLPRSARKVGPSHRITMVLKSRWNRQNPNREGQANPAPLAIPASLPIRPQCRAKQHRSVGSCGVRSKQDITLGRMSSLDPT